jgi:hypothetical protein
MSCTSAMKRHESWEGIQNNTLRIFVKLDIPYAAEQEHTDVSMTENLMNAGLNRAGIILMSYIRIHLTDFERIDSCRKRIEGLHGKMLYQKCTEVSCTALIDFDIKEFLEAAGKHESEP